MRRYTTPTVELVVGGIDLTSCDVYVTLWQQGSEVTTRPGEGDMAFDGTDTTITLRYTQEQTASFEEGRAKMQVNWLTEDGERNCTSVATVHVTGNLLRKVITHG